MLLLFFSLLKEILIKTLPSSGQQQGQSPIIRSSANNFPSHSLSSSTHWSLPLTHFPSIIITCLGLLFHGTCPVPPISVRVPRREALLGIFTSDTNVKAREIGKSRGKGTCGNSGYLISPIPGREISGFYKQPSSERRLLLHTLCRDDLSKS